jgi:predicted nucleic acid-binding protein
VIYLDTSAFIKLYLEEEGSAQVHRLVTSQFDPLPVWHVLELEFHNALRFKVFLADMSAADAGRLLDLYQDRKRNGLYHTPSMDPIALHELALHMTLRTPQIGCRSLDILHVAAAHLLAAERFITADSRQAGLAQAEGIAVESV